MIAEHAKALIVVGETDQQTVAHERRRAVIRRCVATSPMDLYNEAWDLAS
jgi:hypothetical protein